MASDVLGVKVDRVTRKEAINKISDRLKSHRSGLPFQVVTAYSEFFVAAKKDLLFKKVLNGADFVVPDGVGPLAAIDFLDKTSKSRSIWAIFLQGLGTGIKVLRGEIGQPVPGVWLFGELVEKAAREKWRVFLLGGFGNTAARLAGQLESKYPDLVIGSDPSRQWNDLLNGGFDREIEAINSFRPDLLFVAYGPVKQEKWIARFGKRLRAKVVVGVGGTFDELVGNVAATPIVIERVGLKWLWRGLMQPSRLLRTFRAFPVFPWMVFQEGLRRRK